MAQLTAGLQVVYLTSFALYIGSCAVCGVANSINMLIGMRVLQAFGHVSLPGFHSPLCSRQHHRSAAVLTIGAGTLADIFEPKERGSMLGIYYAAPLLGPALGPILGGGKQVLLSLSPLN
jgi:MFS family permease